ncbi:MAG TPA: glycosyltransferase [Rhodopila sp.]|nr:glycosyltransferase [Rhodopila sp.]
MALPDPDLLTRIPLSAHTVLHVGCTDGSLAAAYRPLNPRARLLGVAGDPGDFASAASCYDEIVTAEALPGRLPFDTPDGIDCIVYDGSLEQSPDPWALLRAHAALLTDAGVLLIRARNRSHWRLTEALLRGAADPPMLANPILAGPMLAGLDSDTMCRELEACGLYLADVVVREDKQDAARRFAAAITPALLTLGIDPEQYRERCQGSHRIWRACKSPIRRLHISGSMLSPVGGVSHVRVVHPLEALKTDPSVHTSVTDRIEPRPADTPGIFVLHRPALMGERGTRLLTALAEAGYVIVTEFDDHPDHFPMMRAGGELTFTGVHALQTSTEPLAAELRKYNQEVAVFLNALVSLPEPVNFIDPHAVTLFFGALNRENDWAPFMPVINDVAAMVGSRLRFQVVHDQQFFAALDTPHKSFTPTSDYETYQRLLAASEISFMPLSDTPFNRAKSDLKFIEAASFRVAALASPIVYEDSIRHGETGLVFRDAEDLWQALMRLVDLPNYARRLADNARRHVAAERMMAYQVSGRIAWYRSLWERREVLEQERRKRLARYAGLVA